MGIRLIPPLSVSPLATRKYTVGFTNSISVTIEGVTHKLGSANLGVYIYDNADPASLIGGDVSIDNETFDVHISFNNSQSGRIVLLG